MPLIIEGGRVPGRWLERGNSPSVISIESHAKRKEGLNLALINNMPDAALEDTELQFFELLDVASAEVPVFIRLYSLTGIPRTDRGQRHLNSFYYDFNDIWQNPFDGVIITGTEPKEPDLQDEPYWRLLADVFDWAEKNTTSTVLSCLAAHASVLHGDGIGRHRLPDKQFGVFESRKMCEHVLLNDIGGTIRFPHSRWNEVRDNELTACGYSVIAKSADAGVDVFVKKKKRSLFVHFQGHPEYGAQTLAKEYRRDIRRFLRAERETHPTMPFGYFDESATQALNDFREQALSHRHGDIMASFPESVVEGLQNPWHATAIGIYRNWFQYMAANRASASVFATMASSDRQGQCRLRAAP